MPLFPGLTGEPCPKTGFVQTIVAAASQLDVPVTSPDGASRISGHSLRVSGAQGLTRMGYPLWAVQLLGRWGSETVKGYVGDAALDIFTASAPGSQIGTDALETVLAAAGHRVPPTADPRQTHRPRAAPDAAETQRIAVRVAGDMVAELGEALRAELELDAGPPHSTATCHERLLD